MNREELIFTLRVALTSGDAEVVRTLLRDGHPADLAEALAALGPGPAEQLLGRMPADARAEIFGYFEPEMQLALAARLDGSALADLLAHMDADERADAYARLPTERQAEVLPALTEAERADVRRLAAYPEGSVGAVMTSEVATLEPALTVAEAMGRLRREAPNKETIYDAYVLDQARRLLGTVSLRDLIMAEPEARIETIMRKDPVSVRADAPREEAARLIRDYDLRALPVINGGDQLAGIVTYDDAMDVAEAEATEDFLKTGGYSLAHGRGGHTASLGVSLRDATIGLLYQKRVFWLVLLVFGNLFSGAGIAYFEDTIAAYVALVFFLPLLIDSGGNAGSQAATLTVRALATGDVLLRDWGRMFGREFLVAALLGLTMALAVSVLGLFRGGPEIALVVSLTMVCVVIVGSVIGMSLPFLLSRLKFDPAAASAPLITSIADAAGVIIYFAIATALLPEIAASAAAA
jgi:magnesium transporter